MVGFVTVIGPLNLMFLTRKKRRIWLLWTVPLISLLTCATVFGYMLVSEGWHAHSRTEVLTVLDENARRATTIGWIAFYSPLTPGRGLRFTPDTELSPQLTQDYYWARSSGAARTMDWTSEQHLSSGWVTARTPAQFMVRKTETRRERVEIRRSSNGELTAVNALGADIRHFRYADPAGQVYTAGHIAAGAQATLQPGPKLSEHAPLIHDLRHLYAGDFLTRSSAIPSDWLHSIDRLDNDSHSFLAPGRYIAVLDSAPFMEEGLKAKYAKTRSVVIGIHKESADEN
jgi:hypothetical protein